MPWEVEIPDVVAGQPIESAWGNEIRDKVVHVVATPAALPSPVDDGGIAYVESVDVLYVRRSGVWIPLAIAGGVLGFVRSTTPQTGIGSSATDLTGFSLAVTLPAQRRLRLTASGRLLQQASAGSPSLSFREGGTTLSFIVAEQFASGQARVYDGTSIVDATAGAHTYRLVLSTSAGTVDHNLTATVPGFLMVEDLGPF